MITKGEVQSVRSAVLGGGDRLALMLEALGDQTRLRIFRMLIERRGLCVSDVATILDGTVSASSQQLRVLERVGLVRRERMGQMICYELRADDPCVSSIASFVTHYYQR